MKIFTRQYPLMTVLLSFAWYSSESNVISAQEFSRISRADSPGRGFLFRLTKIGSRVAGGGGGLLIHLLFLLYVALCLQDHSDTSLGHSRFIRPVLVLHFLYMLILVLVNLVIELFGGRNVL
ncbi:hypothetical protein B0H17DRAFT_1209754 [Mycena rosella]|uniref:Uncharacterized protein n=1 Tax=Mycena rosella TaxID=1033263 RepID=A0AAD7CXX2_MYCRO|nr:hypothetical protein B0H17DRAFT_1209754 [Mycena rosella]